MDQFAPDNERVLLNEYEIVECPHVHVAEQFGGPEGPSGVGHTYHVCEDCGETLGVAHKDSVL